MATLILPIGIQGSGKTTWRNRLVAEHGTNIGVISPDEIRYDRFGTYITKQENEVWKIVRTRLEECLTKKPICILDATNAVRKWREMPLSVAKEHNAIVLGVFFDIHPRYAIYRVNKRERKIPPDRIYLYHYQLINDFPQHQEGFDSITTISQNPTELECQEMGGTVENGECRVYDALKIRENNQ